MLDNANPNTTISKRNFLSAANPAYAATAPRSFVNVNVVPLICPGNEPGMTLCYPKKRVATHRSQQTRSRKNAPTFSLLAHPFRYKNAPNTYSLPDKNAPKQTCSHTNSLPRKNAPGQKRSQAKGKVALNTKCSILFNIQICIASYFLFSILKKCF